ncbi:MAG: hypothetical protein JW797_20110 [Bradymonadales bacterium]|nr:hypothetical protein [Bradymonadales bacterium]
MNQPYYGFRSAAGIFLVVTFLLLVGHIPAAQGRPPGPAIEDWLQLGAEYRVETIYINPLELSGTTVTETHWTEQRMRLDMGLRVPGYGGVVVQVDLLDGVLFGDNGDYPREPVPTGGVAMSSYRPNCAGWRVGLAPGADPLDPDSYLPVLQSMEPFRINQAYGEVILPVGLLRLGRQPYNYGAGISAHEGTRINRWGVSRYAHTADRLLFGTKLDQVIQFLIEGGDLALDTRLDRGLLLVLAYDWATQDDIYRSFDDLHQVMFGLQWKIPSADWFGLAWRDLSLSGFGVHRFSNEFDTAVWGVPFRFSGGIGRWEWDAQYSLIAGNSREVSEGFAALTGEEVVSQRILGMGAHLRLDLDLAPVEITFEFDYASGDDDPRPVTDLNVFNFDRDFNVGLLLFEHILAFETARSAAVGIENLQQLESRSFPLTEVASEGRFTNALALFPQVKVDWLQTPRHTLFSRFGALIAWAAASGGVVDPVMTSLKMDGLTVEDDRVNYHGGPSGRYYGTELDLQLAWRLGTFFEWTVEGAVLFPGSGLEDEHSDAVSSFLVENRFTFIF